MQGKQSHSERRQAGKPLSPSRPLGAEVLSGGTAFVATLCLMTLTACDPILDIDGAFFPAWMLCLIVGIILAFACNPWFVRLGIEPYLGPPVLIYPCLALLFTLATWLIFFHT